MEFSGEQWKTLTRLLDEVLDLPADQRSAWIARLERPYTDLRPMLERMLTGSAGVETNEFMATLPKFGTGTGKEAGASHPTIPAGTVIGPYRLVRELGVGGMGTVWLAERADGLLKRLVALKLPHAALGQQQLAERFAREREILAGLIHPHIARLYDAGVTAQGQPYLAMEYVEGVALGQYCDTHRLDLRERLALFQQVLSAVQYAHSQLVVHRDLKPSNILVTSDAQVRLLDFGIAKLLTDGSTRETEFTQVHGRALTPDYASPEQITGAPIGTASDVYSLGVLLYELLCGDRPYRLKRHSRGALEDAITAIEPVRPSQRVVDQSQAQPRASTAKRLSRALAGDLDTIALAALKKNPAERYPTAEALNSDIDRYLRGDPVLAQPDGAWYRIRKFVGRHRLAAGATTLVFLALSASLGFALRQTVMARQQAQRAETESKSAKAIQDFMVDLFATNANNQKDPVKARLTSARELLDIGATRIEQSLKDAPQAKLNLYDVLAGLYTDLDLKDKSIELSRKRIQLAREILPPKSLALAAVLVDAADYADSNDLHDEAEKAGMEALAILDADHDQNSELRARAEIAVGTLFMTVDESKALEHLRKGLELRRRYASPRDLINSLQSMAHVEASSGNAVNGAQLADEAVRIALSLGPEGRGDLTMSYGARGRNQAMLGDFENAEISYRLALKSIQALHEDSEITVAEMSHVGNLATLLTKTSRAKEALALSEYADRAAIDRATKGDFNGDLPYLMSTHATAAISIGRTQTGLAELDAATAIMTKMPPLPDIEKRILAQRARAAIERGQYAQAEHYLRDASALFKEVVTSGLSQNDEFELRFALAIDRGDVHDAETALSSLHVSPPQLSLLSPTQIQQQMMTARLELARAHDDLALAIAARTISQIEASKVEKFYRAQNAQLALVAGKALLNLHRAPEAATVLENGLKLAQSVYDPDQSVAVSQAECFLAQAFFESGKRRQAREHLKKAKAIHAQHRELADIYRKPVRDMEARLTHSA